MDQFKDFQIYHIFREGNKKADQLANKSAEGNNILRYNEQIRSQVKCKINNQKSIY